MKLQVDRVTGREYLVVKNSTDTQNIDINLDKKDLLIASFEGSSRVITKEGRLIVYEGIEPAELYEKLTKQSADASGHSYNFMKFYVWNNPYDDMGDAPHAMLELYSESGGKKYHKMVDLLSRIKVDDFDQDRDMVRPKAIIVYCSNEQFERVVKSVENLQRLDSLGLYKYVNWSHDCTSVLTDVFKGAGFDNHFSEFITDQELLTADESDELTSGKIYLQRYHDFSYKVDTQRGEISAFMKRVEGDDYALRWGEIMDKPVNTSELVKVPNLYERYEVAKETKKYMLPDLVYTSFQKGQVFEHLRVALDDFDFCIKPFIENNDVSYNDLYYYSILFDFVRINDQYKDSSFYKYILGFPPLAYGGLESLQEACENESIQPECTALCLQFPFECEVGQLVESV